MSVTVTAAADEFFINKFVDDELNKIPSQHFYQKPENGTVFV